jgi:TIR domain/Concanavalin A-like lectin/glucanases superfamily
MADPDVFLFVSHISEDRLAALEIVDELERRGVRCWIAPRDVHPGKPFDDEIAEAIEASRALLLIFSDRCNEHEYIRREITVAGESQKVIIPFRIEDAQPRRGLRVRLSDLHWIDGFVSRERAIDQVVSSVDSNRVWQGAEEHGQEVRQPQAELVRQGLSPPTQQLPWALRRTQIVLSAIGIVVAILALPLVPRLTIRAGVSTADFASAVVVTNPLAYWTLQSRNGASLVSPYYPSTDENGAAVVFAGPGAPEANALSLQGNTTSSPQYISTGLSGGIPGQGSMMAWVNLANLPSLAGRIFYVSGESQFGNDFDVQFRTDNNICFYTGGGEYTNSAPDPATLVGNWHMITVTYRGGSNGVRNIYWDGTLAASFTGAVYNGIKSNPFNIGYSTVFTGRNFNGLISNVAIWDKPLTGQQISTIYSARGGSSTPEAASVSRYGAALLALTRLDNYTVAVVVILIVVSLVSATFLAIKSERTHARILYIFIGLNTLFALYFFVLMMGNLVHFERSHLADLGIFILLALASAIEVAATSLKAWGHCVPGWKELRIKPE